MGALSEWSGEASGDVAFLCDADHEVFCDFSAATMGSGAICRAKKSAGGACQTSEACTADAYCDSKSSTCAARLAVGAPCTGDICATTAFCDQATNACKMRAPDGAPCSGSNECLGGECHNASCATSAGLGGLALALLCGK